MSKSMQNILATAIAENILPVGANLSKQAERPLPVVLLTTLGVWLGALPIVIGILWMIYEVFGEALLQNSLLLYGLGFAILLGSIFTLRKENIALFVEQLAFALLLTGGAIIWWALFEGIRDNSWIEDSLRESLNFLFLASITAISAWLIPRVWIRQLLGLAAASLLAAAWEVHHHYDYVGASWRNSTPLLLLAFWLGLLWLQRWAASQKTPSLAVAIEPFASGWVVATLLFSVSAVGSTFLLGGGGYNYELIDNNAHASFLVQHWQQIISVLLALSAVLFAGWKWPSIRQIYMAMVGVLLCVLAWFMPQLGLVLLILSIAFVTYRYHTAIFAGLALAWIIGAFYFQLHWLLVNKALLLLGIALGLALLAWFANKKPKFITAALTAKHDTKTTWLLAGGALLVAAFANVGIWQKEDVILHGKPVFIKLAPVDPRSLMQGDYMALNYEMPRVPDEHTVDVAPTDQEAAADKAPPKVIAQPYAIATQDAQGIATIVRIAEKDAPLATGEFLIKLKRVGQWQGWTIISDAWYFKEGTGEHWAKAKYGEFRIKPDGSALLVGLADEHAKAIKK